MIEVYIDGASAGNPGLSGAGIYIKGPGVNEKYSFPLGVMSNQEAEFASLLHALTICGEKGFQTVSFRTDSDIVYRSVEKRYVKNKQFAPYLEKALTYIDQFLLFFIKWIPSRENKVADQLAREAIQKNTCKQKG